MRKTNKNNNEKIAYKFVIYPDACQKEMFAKTFGCCRKLWNVMLSDHNFFYDANAVSNLYKYGIEYLTKSGFDLY